jgi:hypothetical protein
VFRDTELFIGIARLSILFEDLRLEMAEFERQYDEIISRQDSRNLDRTPYYLRRAIGTLAEFGRGLNVVRRMDEFKNAQLSAMDEKYIIEADKFIQQNWKLIKDLRNEFGGHVQTEAVEFAVKHLTNEVGVVTWNPDPEKWSIGIECDFAKILLAGASSSKFQSGSDVGEEFRRALAILTEGLHHVQFAMTALVHAFLWDRFG